MNILEQGYKVYEKSGQAACIQFAYDKGITDEAFCEPCDIESPYVTDQGKKICFVCWTPIKEDNDG